MNAPTVPEQHQLKIAKRSLSMTPQACRILGGMTFEEAYHLVYRKDLRTRLAELIAEYGDGDLYSWELGRYGYNNPTRLLAAL